MFKEVRCPNCNRKLGNVDGRAEIKCQKCKSLILFDGTGDKNITRVERDYSQTDEYPSMRSRVTSTGHRFE